MTGPGRVVVVGSVNIDFIVRVAHLPHAGETVVGGRFERHDGGKGGNQAVAAARVGASAAFVGAVGDDDLGDSARRALATDGVDVSALASIPGVATGVAFILVDDTAENSIAVASGANYALTPTIVVAALDRLALRPADVVLVTHEIPTDATASALAVGRSAGSTTILNPAPATGLDLATLALADILTPNAGELEVLQALGPSTIGDATLLVSLGAEGARLVVAGRVTTISALPVAAIDTVGAGDTLNGVLAAGLASGLSVEEAAKRAVVAASLAVTRSGARGGMPTLTELEAALGGASG